MLVISLILLIISSTYKKNIERTKKKFGIQHGKITYSDLNKPAKSFFSKKYRIAGKPDYIVKRDNRFLPVEVKTGKSYNGPQKNHIYQLAAYCHLLEENYGIFVPYGILVYNDQVHYKIPYDPSLRFELENTIEKMRSVLRKGNIIKNHNDPQRCLKCSMRDYCNVKIL